MADHIVITIGRQYGSGGRDIGKKLAEALGIPCYDKELLSVIHKLKHWKHFVYGREFVVLMDHQALRWLHSMPNAHWSDR